MSCHLEISFYEEDELPLHYLKMYSSTDIIGIFVDAVGEDGELSGHIIETYVDVNGYMFRFAIIRDPSSGQRFFYRINFSTFKLERVFLVTASNINIAARGRYLDVVKSDLRGNKETKYKKD